MSRRVVKLQDHETTKFLDLYSNERILYDPTLEAYKDRDLRMAAAKRISDAMQISGFGPNEVIAKFKNLRSSFCQELKKIADSERSGVGTGDIYKPKVFWFVQMNAFIRPFVQQRQTQTNLMLPTSHNTESQLELKQSQKEQVQLEQLQLEPSHIEHSQLQHSQLQHSPLKHSQLEHFQLEQSKQDFNDRRQRTTQTETPRKTIKRKTPLTTPQSSSSSKIEKVWHDPQIDFVSGAIEKFQEYSSRAAHISKDDSFDCFGKYVASMLRSIGPPIAIRLQETITSLIVNAIIPPPVISSGQSTLSRTDSATSDCSD